MLREELARNTWIESPRGKHRLEVEDHSMRRISRGFEQLASVAGKEPGWENLEVVARLLGEAEVAASGSDFEEEVRSVVPHLGARVVQVAL
jgi:hypothetical protein